MADWYFKAPAGTTITLAGQSIMEAVSRGDRSVDGLSLIIYYAGPNPLNIGYDLKDGMIASNVVALGMMHSYYSVIDLYGATLTINETHTSKVTFDLTPTGKTESSIDVGTTTSGSLFLGHVRIIHRYFKDPALTQRAKADVTASDIITMLSRYSTSDLNGYVKLKTLTEEATTDWFGNRYHLEDDLAYYVNQPSDTSHSGVWYENSCLYVALSGFAVDGDFQFTQDCYLKQFTVTYPYYQNGTFLEWRTKTVNSGQNCTLGEGSSYTFDIGSLTGYSYTQWEINWSGGTITKAKGTSERFFDNCTIPQLDLTEDHYTVRQYSMGYLEKQETVTTRVGTTLVEPTHRGTGAFMGWFDAETGGNFVGYAGDLYQPLRDIDLYAHWQTVYAEGVVWKLKDPVKGYIKPEKIEGHDDAYLFVIDGTTARQLTISAMKYPLFSTGDVTIKLPTGTMYTIISQGPAGPDDRYQDAIVQSPAQALDNTYSVIIAETTTGTKSYAYLYTIQQSHNVIRFHWNDGLGTINTVMLESGRLTTIPTPTKTVAGVQYEFNGWLTATGKKVDTDTIFVVSDDVYASWTPPATYNGKDFLILQKMTSDSDHSQMDVQFNLGTIPSLSDVFQITCNSLAIPTLTSERAFAIDTGITQTMTVTFKRASPEAYDNDAEDSERWSNGKWISELEKMINRYQAVTDGVKLALIPGDCSKHTMRGRNYYYGKYFRLMGTVQDKPKYEVVSKSELTSKTDAVKGDVAHCTDGKWYMLNGVYSDINAWLEDTDGTIIGQSKDRLGVGYKYTNADGESHIYLGMNAYLESISHTYTEGTPDWINGTIRMKVGGLKENYR